MILSLAQVEETDEVFGMYEDFNGKELEKIGMKYAPQILMRNVVDLIEKKSVIVAKNSIGRIVGAVAGVVMPCAFTEDVLFISMLFYVRPDHRHRTVEFIKKIMDFFKDSKVTKFIVSNPAYSPDGMDRFYKMNGGKALETHFVFNVRR